MTDLQEKTENIQIPQKAIFKYKNGMFYKGEWKIFENQKLRNGQGLMIYKIKGLKKETYEGNFEKNKRNGKGIYSFINGDVYNGNFKEDNFNGKVF